MEAIMWNCFAISPVFVQAIQPAPTMLMWGIQSIGIADIFVFVTGLIIFVGACYLIATKKKPSVIAAYLILLPLPVIISICGTIKGMISSLAVIASVDNLPTYFVLAFGLISSSLKSNSLVSRSATASS
jgi:hypothetical protein